jgi:hypothetical protein
MTFYSYGLTEEQQPGALTYNKSLAAASADSAAATTRKGPNPLQISVIGTQFTGPGGGNSPFSSDFSADFGGGAGYIFVSVSKLAKASNAAAYALTPAKFTSHFPVLQAVSAQIASLLRPYRGQRRLSGTSSDAAALTYTNPHHTVVAATTPAAGQLRRSYGRFLPASTFLDPFSPIFTSVFGGPTVVPGQPSVAALIRTLGNIAGVTRVGTTSPAAYRLFKAPNKTPSAVSPQGPGLLKASGKIVSATPRPLVAALLRIPGRALGVASAAATRVARAFPYRVAVASASAAVLGFGGGNLYARVFGVASGGAPLLGRGMSVYRLAVSAESARLLKTSGRLLGVAGASAAGAVKAAGRLLGMASASVVGAAVRLPNIVRGVASATVVTAQRSRLVASLTALIVAQAENVLAVTQHVVGRPLALPRTQTASISISAVVSHLRALAVLQAQVVASAASQRLFRFLAAVSGAAQASVRSVGYPLGVAASGISGLLTITQHAVALAVAGTMAAFLRASHSLTRGVGSIEVAAVVPLHLRNTIVGALNGSSVALRRGIAYPLAILGSQAVAITRAIGKAIVVPGASAVSLSRLFFRFPATASPQAAGLVPRYGSKIGGVVSASAAGLFRRTAKLAGSLSQQAVAAGRIDFKIIGATLGNVASMIRPRGFHLGAVQSQIAAVVDWFHLFVPDWAAQQTVLLPPGGGPAEPPDFGPIDPLDETTFAFNWSSRADPNDAIVSATVVSVPPGLTFAASPVFISGTLVQVTVVPSTPPLLPAVYKLRCTAVFASGRRSSFSIPVPVKTL